jgi:hypothetical protein
MQKQCHAPITANCEQTEAHPRASAGKSINSKLTASMSHSRDLKVPVY